MSKVHVLFWFDVEDYIAPQSDDALKRLAEIFHDQDAKATFKFVGEKIRALEARGRDDVIKAVAAHDIGYHTDNHSQHPTVSEYLEGLGWDEGAAEFERRERPGMDDLERIFGKRVSCYGQPGGAWAPQVYPVLKKWGVPVYLDEAQQVGLNDQPFWYCGIINVLKMQSNCTRVSLRPGDDALPRAKAEFDRIYERLRPNDGTVSIYYHPCEFVTTQFWDGVNFSRGKNTPREEWRLPGLKPHDEVERGYRLFSDYLAYIKSHPQVEIITAAQSAELYRDQAVGRTFSIEEILQLARDVQSEISYCVMDDFALSPAEVFSLIISSLADYSKTGKLPDSVPFSSPLGPVARAMNPAEEASLDPADLLRACVIIKDFMEKAGRLPSAVYLGNQKLDPADFLSTVSHAFVNIAESGNLPDKVGFCKGNFTLEKYVTGEGAWGWVIFPEGFHAPGLIDLGKLQTWTLKLAICSKW
jgi:peptidoglycan/xylan/chitin deacetylase (PgdA/CDA1 family)